MTETPVLSRSCDDKVWSRTRLSKNFFLRDFMFSTEAVKLNHSNYPSDDVKQVVESGRQLFTKVLESILEHFGKYANIFGYMSRETIERGLTPEDRMNIWGESIGKINF